ncbi:MAG: sialidase family protein [Polyangiaceae bacterium]|nr:sialidase family protein [Polyangiaceae bacterium]
MQIGGGIGLALLLTTSACLQAGSISSGTYDPPASSGNDTKPNPNPSSDPNLQAGPRLVVEPQLATLAQGATHTFTCVAVGLAAGCAWSVQGGPANGTVQSNGVYTAPSSPGVYRVVATSTADPNVTSAATVTVPAAGGDCTPGVWHKIPGIAAPFSVLVDPVRPSHTYAFFNDSTAFGQPMRVATSADYGATWQSTETNFSGYAWGAAIDPNPARDPTKQPTIYLNAGYGNGGLYRSTDDGLTWTQLFGERDEDPAVATVSIGRPISTLSTSFPTTCRITCSRRFTRGATSTRAALAAS